LDAVWTGIKQKPIKFSNLSCQAQLKKAETKPFHIFFLILFISVYTNQYGQVIKGFVTDSKTNERLFNVYIVSNNSYTSTDNDGFFELLLEPGEYIIEARLLGFQASRKKITINKNETKELFFELQADPYNLDTVIVFEKRNPPEVIERAVELFQGDLKNIPQLGEPDAFRALFSLPGVITTSDLSNQLYVRGGNFDETLIALDGVPIYNPYHFGGIFSTVNSDIIYSERIFLSNYPVTVGGYISGTLDITSKTGNREKVKTSGTLSLLSTRVLVNGPLWKGSFIFSARRTYFDLIGKILKEYFPYYFYDTYTKYTLPIDQNVFNISFFYSKDKLDFFEELLGSDAKIKDDPNWGNILFNIDWSHFFNDNSSIKTKFFTSNSYVQADGSLDESNVRGDLSRFYMNNQLTDYTLNIMFNYSKNNFTFRSGIEFKHLSANYNWLTGYIGEVREYIKPVEDVFFDYAPMKYQQSNSSTFINGYSLANFSLTKNINIEAGIRGNYYHQIHNLSISPQMNIEIIPITNCSIVLNYGRYEQYLYTLKELKNASIYSPFSVYLIAKNENEIAKSDHYSISFSVDNLPGHIDFGITAYYKNRENLAAAYNIMPRYRFEDGYAYGLETKISTKIYNIENSISYSFSRSIKIGRDYSYFAGYDRTHSLKITSGYSLSERWKLNAYWTYATGIPYTEVIGRYWGSLDFRNDYNLHENIPFAYNEWRPLYANKNTKRMDANHRLDIGISGSFIWGKMLVSPYLQVLNVYNSPNPYFYGVDLEYQGGKKLKYYGSHIVPTLGVTIDL